MDWKHAEDYSVPDPLQEPGHAERDYYLNQKKTLEINTRHPLVKELLRRVEDNPADPMAKDIAVMMFNTATLR